MTELTSVKNHQPQKYVRRLNRSGQLKKKFIMLC